MTFVNVLKQVFIVKIEDKFDEKEALQEIIDESEKKKSKERR
jgi:hypothetical protein